MPQKIQYLDGLRGIACLFVVMSHISNIYHPGLHGGEGLGFWANSPFLFFISGAGAVYVFFVLSGIVLAKSVARKDKKKYIVSFVHRYPRLAIPATISCLIVFSIFLNIGKLEFYESNWFNNLYVENNSLLSATFDGAFHSFFYGISKYNNVLWTMQVELIGSFIVYLCQYILDRHGKKNGLFTFLIIISIIGIISKSLGLSLACFLFGFCIYNFQLKIKHYSILVFIIGLYFLGINSNNNSYWIIYSLLSEHAYVLSNFIGALMIVFATVSSTKLQGALNTKVFTKLGELSFSIYLLHIPVIYLVMWGTSVTGSIYTFMLIFVPSITVFSIIFSSLELDLNKKTKRIIYDTIFMDNKR
ncbi:TPA: acyltransferase [Vibrio alginolyticus]|nr:acyltransferase [Vibrio alginolyticus]